MRRSYPPTSPIRSTVPLPVRLVAAVVAIAAVTVGCTGDGGLTTAETDGTTTSTTEAPATSADPEQSMIASGGGVDVEARTITLGILADLTGPFAALAVDVTDAQLVYWDRLNREGGIDGWTVDVVVRDTKNSPLVHREAYEQIRDDVAAIAHATGSTPNLEMIDTYVDDDMVVIPLSWYSGWAIPAVDGGVMVEQNTNYCIEAMNIVDFIVDMGAESVAIVSFDDDFGRDAAAGVLVASDHYGIDVAHDGTGTVEAGGELGPAITAIAESGADWTFLGTNSAVAAQLIAGAVQLGYEGMFTGPAPTYDARLLDSASAELFATRFYQSAYAVSWGEPQPGNLTMMEAMAEAYPDRRPSDAFIVGWNAGVTMRAVLEQAIRTRDVTRSGILIAARSLGSLDFAGAAPDQGFAGTPNEYVVRESAIYKPNLELYRAAGGADQQLSQEGATTGSELIRPFFVGDAASSYEFTEPCSGT